MRDKDMMTAIDPPQHRLAAVLKLYDRKDFVPAAAAAEGLLSEFPNAFVLWSLLGSINTSLGKPEIAETCLRKAQSSCPDSAIAHHNLGFFLRTQGRLDEALAAFDRTLELDANTALAHFYRGTILYSKGDSGNALKACNEAIRLNPRFAEAHYYRGAALAGIGKFEEALATFSNALKLKPDFAEAHHERGILLFYGNELAQAITAFEKALHFKPELKAASAFKRYTQGFLCDFSNIDTADFGDEISPLSGLILEDAPDRQQVRSADEWKLCNIAPLPMVHTRSNDQKLRLGYFSADFHDHATLHLLSGVFREHDKSSFEVFIYSYGTRQTGSLLERLRLEAPHFQDVQSLSDHEICKVARADNLDIAIDLKGYTAQSRSQIFGARLAPIQINYLGYPGTMGCDAFDYIVADRNVIPHEFRQFYDENVIYMPHTYQPNDNLREIEPNAPNRADVGLPDDAVVLCCFNQPCKITAAEFDIWMRVLAKVDRAVLWLLRWNPWMEDNLRKQAAARGVLPDRLIFSNKALHSEHLARHCCADLFLDTFNYNAHTTASDAIWAGLPVVTKCGKQFAARVAASLLNAANLSELITYDEEQYEAKILELATHPEKLRQIKASIAANRLTCPLFDTQRYTRNFEYGLQLVHNRYVSGSQPADIFVPDQQTQSSI